MTSLKSHGCCIILSTSCWFVSKMLYVAGVILSHVWVWLNLDCVLHLVVEERVLLEWAVKTFVSCWLAERVAPSDFLFLTLSASLDTAVPFQCDLIIRRRPDALSKSLWITVHQPLFVRSRCEERNRDGGWKRLKFVTRFTEICFFTFQNNIWCCTVACGTKGTKWKPQTKILLAVIVGINVFIIINFWIFSCLQVASIFLSFFVACGLRWIMNQDHLQLVFTTPCFVWRSVSITSFWKLHYVSYRHHQLLDVALIFWKLFTDVNTEYCYKL